LKYPDATVALGWQLTLTEDDMKRFPIVFAVMITVSVTSPRASELSDAQRELEARGYSVGPADGIMGERTRNAINRFQKENSIPVTGKLDPAIEAILLSAESPQTSTEADKKEFTKIGVPMPDGFLGKTTESDLLALILEFVRERHKDRLANASIGLATGIDFRMIPEDKNTVYVHADPVGGDNYFRLHRTGDDLWQVDKWGH
jgi:peptidoglycan hydrolase-like protein with peptidoglycan-binding domain